MPQMKTTSYGRKTQTIKTATTYPLDQTQHLNLSYDWKIRVFKCLKWRKPQMEDDLKILKVEYLSNYRMDQSQILSLTVESCVISMAHTMGNS